MEWDSWCNAIQLENQEYNELVAQLLAIFEVVYTWSFVTVYDKVMLDYFTEKVVEFIAKWKPVMGGGKSRNYYHWLQVEALIQIKVSGSIWKYSSDITESFVHLIKDYYLRYSNRGGLQKHWTKQVMHRILVRVYLKSLNCEDWTDIMTTFEKRKLLQEMVQRHLV